MGGTIQGPAKEVNPNKWEVLLAAHLAEQEKAKDPKAYELRQLSASGKPSKPRRNARRNWRPIRTARKSLGNFRLWKPPSGGMSGPRPQRSMRWTVGALAREGD